MSRKRAVLLQRVQAHEGPINTMCLGKTSALVYATGGDDKILNLWTVGKDTPPAVFGPLNSPVTACEFASGDTEIACGNQSGTVRLFNINALKCVCTFPVHRCEVTSVCFNPLDNDMMFSVGCDGVLQVLSTQSDKPVASIPAHDGPARCVCVSHDGRFVATGGDDKSVKVFDMKMAKNIAVLKSHDGAVSAVEFCPTANILASGGADRQTIFYDLAEMSEIEGRVSRHTSAISKIRFSLDYNVAVGVSSDCLQILSYDPPGALERVQLDMSKVLDLSVFQSDIMIASTERGKALVTRVKADDLGEISRRPVPKNKDKVKGVPSPQAKGGDAAVFSAFVKERNAFISEMNDRYTKIGSIGRVVREAGLAGALTEGVKNPDFGEELLSLLADKPQVVKLEDSVMLLHIAKMIINDNPDLAILTITNQVKVFGALVRATKSPARGRDNVHEGSKQKSEEFRNMLKLLVVDVQRIASEKTSLGKKATALLNDWKVLLK